jgi:hypothetical protein
MKRQFTDAVVSMSVGSPAQAATCWFYGPGKRLMVARADRPHIGRSAHQTRHVRALLLLAG